MTKYVIRVTRPDGSTVTDWEGAGDSMSEVTFRLVASVIFYLREGDKVEVVPVTDEEVKEGMAKMKGGLHDQ